MISLNEIVGDLDFAQYTSFIVTRTTGSFVNGTFTINAPTTLTVDGIIIPTKTRDIKMVPGGDTVSGNITLYTEVVLLTTHIAQSQYGSAGVADEITWRGNVYKIVSSDDFLDFGYFKSIATRKQGA